MSARIAPVSPGDAVRARVPDVLLSHRESVAAALGDGHVDGALKDLCARYLAEDGDVVAHAADPARFTARERAALAWTHAIAWDSDGSDAELWSALHAHFDEPQLVELGYAIAYTMGQQRWLATMGLED
jgi:alkylhydroperoxidase family enzyme